MDDQALLDAYRQLTDRQDRVLALLCRGRPRVEIASALGMKPRVVDADIAVIYHAFQLDDSGLTPAQRRFELRHALQLVRKMEQQEASAASGASIDAPLPPPPIDAPIDEPADPKPDLPGALVPVPAPNPVPQDVAPWRSWPYLMVIVMMILLVLIGSMVTWRVTTTPPGPRRAVASVTTRATPQISSAAIVPVPFNTALASPTATTIPTTATPAITFAPTTVPTVIPPTLAPSPVATVIANTTPVALAGKVASTRPGTPLVLGQAVTSIVDYQAKRHDVYALQLRAGQTLHVEVSAATEAFGVIIAAPGAENLVGEPSIPLGTFLCNYVNPCRKDFAIAADGTYTLVIGTDMGAGMRYTLRAMAP